MRVALFYGVALDPESARLESGAELWDFIQEGEIEASLPEGVEPGSRDRSLLRLYGGSNNDGSVYIGREAKALFKDYESGSVGLDRVMALSQTPEAQAMRSWVDAWWAESEKAEELRAELNILPTRKPGWLLVADSD